MTGIHDWIMQHQRPPDIMGYIDMVKNSKIEISED